MNEAQMNRSKVQTATPVITFHYTVPDRFNTGRVQFRGWDNGQRKLPFSQALVSLCNMLYMFHLFGSLLHWIVYAMQYHQTVSWDGQFMCNQRDPRKQSKTCLLKPSQLLILSFLIECWSVSQEFWFAFLPLPTLGFENLGRSLNLSGPIQQHLKFEFWHVLSYFFLAELLRLDVAILVLQILTKASIRWAPTMCLYCSRFWG